MNINVSEEDSKYMYDFVQSIIDEIGPRMSCSSQEAEAAEFIKKNPAMRFSWRDLRVIQKRF